MLPISYYENLEPKLAIPGPGSNVTNELSVLKYVSPAEAKLFYAESESISPDASNTKKLIWRLRAWLASGTRLNRHERETMRVAARSKFLTNTKVFEDTSIVARTNLLIGHTPNQYRAVCTEMNIKAVREFILDTTRG